MKMKSLAIEMAICIERVRLRESPRDEERPIKGYLGKQPIKHN